MKRYNQQIALTEIGISGQQKLKDAKVLIIGAGGLGCPVLQNLAGAGVGFIGIVDGDLIEETNLHRQYLYSQNDCGKKKVDVATEVVSKQNPEITIIPYTVHFTQKTCYEIICDYQIIVDCTDDNATRYLINDISLVNKIPMVYASIHKFEGQLSVFNYENGPSYRCLFPENDNLFLNSNCNNSGVMGVLPNILGIMQANEVLKIILGIGEVINGELLMYNSLNNHFQKINFKKKLTEIEKGIQNGLSILNRQVEDEVIIISAKEFQEEVENPTTIIMDVRELYEEPKLDLPNIKLVPLAQLEDFLKAIDNNQKIILFCQQGKISLMAAKYLKQKGYNQIGHLQNGINSLENIRIKTAIIP
jgi:adenylyltransferase/sulfurtransferase